MWVLWIRKEKKLQDGTNILQHLFSLDYVICTEAKQSNYHSESYHGCGHLHSADVWTLMLPLPKGIVRDNSHLTQVITMPSVYTKVVNAEC